VVIYVWDTVTGKLGICAAIVMLGMALAVSASATDYKGDVDHLSILTLTIANGNVTALKGRATAQCQSGSAEAVDITLGAPVAIAGGRFHAEGQTGSSGSTWSLTLDATVSPDTRKVSGTIAVTGTNTAGPCSGTSTVSAIAMPASVSLPAKTTFVRGKPTGSTDPSVRFDYTGGRVFHLSARADTKCPSGASLGTTFSTTAYGLDPIRVNGRAFRTETDVLNEYDIITHVVLVGSINGRKASGRIESEADSKTFGHCVGHFDWTAYRPVKSPYAGASAATWIDVFRVRQRGHWTYYLQLGVSHCVGGMTAVRFKVLHVESKRVACARRRIFVRTARLMVKPKRRYTVVETGLIARNGRVVATKSYGTRRIYVPVRGEPCYTIGDDGNLTPCPREP
jgi:hypothetical protein